MKLRLLAVCLLLGGVMTPAFASANPEPTAYDTRSISMGLTGTTYMERASALALNPANLEGIEKLGFTLNFTAIFTNQIAPVQGPGTEGRSGVGFGPIPSGFIAGRIAPRVVFGAGLVIETGYGSSFDNVVCLDGAPVSPNPADGNNPPYTPSTDPATCTNPDPQDLDVTFFVGEASVGTSFMIHEKFWLGLALRLPFSKQVADLYQNIGAALGSVAYGRVKNDLSGVGFPSPRLGITIKPHPKVNIGIMYRMWSRIRLTGTTDTSLFPDTTFDATADWNIPHAIQVGVSYQPNPYLLNAFELRLQFHGADKQGNLNQTVITNVLPPTIVAFGWETVWSAKYGVEYRFRKADVVSWRGGVNVARSATTEAWAQYFTPPPGISVTGMTGLGFYWNDRNNPNIKDKYMLDIGTLITYSGTNIGDEYIGTIQQVPGTSANANDQIRSEVLCSGEGRGDALGQVVRTGCPGRIGVWTWWASVSFTLQY
jgi:long-subunit fatty acid transport protein